MLNGRTLDTLKEELYMENSSAWSELKICTDTEEGFRDTVLFIVRDMIKRGVKGASFIFNPHSLINRGLDISKTFEILNPFLTNLIKKEIFYPLFRIGVNRRDGINELEYIAKLFTKERKKYLWIEAIDINGDEKKFPLNPFVPELLNLK
ncbi:hypothetical protein GX830_01480, partial [Candidatus Dojkabacteria bacterium]|nr:hypothetical protein [Candidatus Dojkabacteria bacterium]